MADQEIRELERLASAGDLQAEKRLQRVKLRTGHVAFVWCLRYGEDSVGLSGSIVSLFTNRQACVDHIKKHEPGFSPGFNWNRVSAPSRRKFDESHNEWSNGYRTLVISKIEVHESSPDKWWAKGCP